MKPSIKRPTRKVAPKKVAPSKEVELDGIEETEEEETKPVVKKKPIGGRKPIRKAAPKKVVEEEPEEELDEIEEVEETEEETKPVTKKKPIGGRKPIRKAAPKKVVEEEPEEEFEEELNEIEEEPEEELDEIEETEEVEEEETKPVVKKKPIGGRKPSRKVAPKKEVEEEPEEELDEIEEVEEEETKPVTKKKPKSKGPSKAVTKPEPKKTVEGPRSRGRKATKTVFEINEGGRTSRDSFVHLVHQRFTEEVISDLTKRETTELVRILEEVFIDVTNQSDLNWGGGLFKLTAITARPYNPPKCPLSTYLPAHHKVRFARNVDAPEVIYGVQDKEEGIFYEVEYERGEDGRVVPVLDEDGDYIYTGVEIQNK